jgi:Anp1
VLGAPAPSTRDRVLILTPVKQSAGHLDHYFAALERLEHARDRLSLGLLESDSSDGTYELLEARLPWLKERFVRVTLLKRDFGYQMPAGLPRWAPALQLERRTVLAKSRNHLLLGALADEDWVLWLDVDVREYPSDIIGRLLAPGVDIVMPHCVTRPGGSTFDLNAWSHGGRLHLEDLRGGPELVPLDTVGGTMLLVRADAHRDGLNFPAFPYGRPNPLARDPSPMLGVGVGEVESEGLGLMARDLGYECWGMPHLEVVHADE